MKKVISGILVVVLLLSVFAGCAKSNSDKKIVIGASITPHVDILKEAEKQLKEKGYELVVKEFSDWELLNPALEEKEIDANYFQHKPYLDNFNKEKGTHLVSVGAVHYEPVGIYAGKTKSIADLKDGASILIPNDTTNEGRALMLLQSEGVIKLKSGVGVNATKRDILVNKKNIKFTEIEAAQLVRSLQDVDLAVINGNYALLGGLKVSNALVVESEDSSMAATYANIIVVRKGDENREGIKALIEVLKSPEIKDYIRKTFDGAVIPAK